MTDERGVVLLITVIIVGALVLAIGVSAVFMGQTEVIKAGYADRSRQVSLLASACVDEALQRLKLDVSYTGGTVPVNSESCTVTVTGTGTTRTITAVGAAGGHTKTLLVGATLRQNSAGSAKVWSVDSWTESGP